MTKVKTNKFDRPGLFWSITLDAAKMRYVTMRVTRITMDRIYGGVEDEGTYRKHGYTFGRFPTRNAAGQMAAQMNFIVAKYSAQRIEYHNAIAQINEALAALDVSETEEINAFAAGLPQTAIMEDSKGRH